MFLGIILLGEWGETVLLEKIGGGGLREGYPVDDIYRIEYRSTG